MVLSGNRYGRILGISELGSEPFLHWLSKYDLLEK
jgi:hypothetical protein